VILLANENCIEWQGKLFTSGYGHICVSGKSKGVHRVLVEGLIGRSLKRDEYVCHKCDNKKCFNPNHLYIGDAKTNYKDMEKVGKTNKGRHHSEQTRNKIRHSLIGQKLSEERKKKISESWLKRYKNGYISKNKGRKAKPNSGSFSKGSVAPNKGRKKCIIDGRVRYIFP
jgi:hypothetical protein